MKDSILLAFYGDDFTGSTDALEFISRAGARAVLFIGLPDKEFFASFEGLDAYGIAGTTRALAPDELARNLVPALEQMQQSGAAHIHYKVCSTFDSARERGSIGQVIDLFADRFGAGLIPVLGGAPSLGRYCVFGNLFARMGIGTAGQIHRLDRHPSMRNHPVTPADESDLRCHLGRQTERAIGLVDILQLEKDLEVWTDEMSESVVLIDALNEAQLVKIGRWLAREQNRRQATLYSIGASSVEQALGSYWQDSGRLLARSDWSRPEPCQPLLVISGSCSPVTADQIAWALAHGFEELVLDGSRLQEAGATDVLVAKMLEFLVEGKSLILHTGARRQQVLDAKSLGNQLGSLVRKVLAQTHLKRLVIAGGDTSSYTATALGIEALEMMSPLIAGAPLCKAYSRDPVVNGLEVNFKGGQVGPENYFEILSRGRL